VVGVRVNSRAAADILVELFADRHVPDAQPPPNVSVFLASSSGRGIQDLHRVYLQDRRALRSRSVIRVFQAVWHVLDGLGQIETGVLPLLEATVLLENGRAHVLDAGRRPRLADDERRWQTAGFRLIDRPFVTLDLGRAAVEVPVCPITADQIHRRSLLELGGADRSAPPPPAGRYPLASWSPGEADTRAGRVARAVGRIVNRGGLDGHGLVRSVAAQLERLPDGAGIADPAELRRWLRSL
jgi:hypothetical protein